jgi:hypothetical protein
MTPMTSLLNSTTCIHQHLSGGNIYKTQSIADKRRSCLKAEKVVSKARLDPYDTKHKILPKQRLSSLSMEAPLPITFAGIHRPG